MFGLIELLPILFVATIITILVQGAPQEAPKSGEKELQEAIAKYLAEAISTSAR